MRHFRLMRILLVFAFTVFGALAGPNHATAASAAEIDRNAQKALQDLYAKSPAAKTLGEKAIGILVFPGIVKGGFIVGGQYGEGALIRDGKTVAYYNTVAASYGLQAGLQKFGYALFFMTDSALKWIDKSDGWEIGVGPSIVVVDVGAAAAMTSTTLQSDIYAFFFDQKGLMAGLGLQGTKITRLEK
ncbi:MAG: YSC84-related protein [Desulfobacterales bacterium]|jgi:lipid-binding SYLF domain-containing protein|nr:YSC84-related protein [Desulfobacterales bacterium]